MVAISATFCLMSSHVDLWKNYLRFCLLETVVPVEPVSA